MNINSLNGVQNFSVFKNSNVNNEVTNPNLKVEETLETPQKQIVDAKIALANYSVPKVNMSFKGNIQEQPKEMSDEEFEKLKQELKNTIENSQLSEFDKNFYTRFLKYSTKENIQVAEKIISDENLSNNPDCADFFQALWMIDNHEKSELVVSAIGNDKLLNNKNFIVDLKNLISYDYSKEQHNVAKVLLSKKDLFDYEFFTDNVLNIVKATDKYNEDFAQYISNRPDLLQNKLFMKNASDFLYMARSDNNKELAKSILDRPDLLQNKVFMRNVSNIKFPWVNIDDYPEKKESCQNMIDTILSDEKFFGNKSVMKNARNIIVNFDSKIVQKIMSDEKLYSNENLMNNLDKLLNSRNKDITEIILNNEDLYGNKNFMDKSLGKLINYLYNTTYMLNPLTDDIIEERKNIVKTILSDKDLYDNEDFIEKSEKIFEQCKTKEQTEVANIILSHKELPNFDKFIGNMAEFMWEWGQPGQIDIFKKITDDMDSDKIERVENFRAELIQNADKFMAIFQTKDKQECMDKLNEIIDSAYFHFIQESSILNTDELTTMQKFLLVAVKDKINYKDFIKLNKTIGKENAEKLSPEYMFIAANFIDVYKKQNINEISRNDKKSLLKALVAADKGLFNISDEMKEMFPIIPTNQKDYCKLLPSVVRSLGFDTNVILDKHFDEKLSHLGETLSNISDEDFKTLDIKQEYSRDEFIKDVHDKVKDLSREERQKVYDYFGFELHHNKKANTGFTITGYPMNLNNGEKLSQIKDPQTKAVIENLRENVIKFTQNNKIVCENKELENDLNNIIKSLPELRATIGLKQRGNGENFGHDYDVFTHSLKVMQGIVKDPKYQKLNDSDKKIMLFASLLHDIAKKEGFSDSHHADNSSFDASFIVKKFKLTQEEEIKLFTLIKNHEWNNYVNNASDEKERKRRQQSVAYDLRHDNLFDMSLIFTHADLKGVNDYFHDLKNEDRISKADGITRSYGEAADFHAQSIKKYIEQLKPSQPLLPVTKIPSSSDIEKSITEVKLDGSTNIKGVYKDKDGLIVIKYNELQNEDLEKIGFSCLSTTKGIEAKTSAGESVNTGNVKFFAHGFDEPYQLAKFDAFNLINSEVLLSVSYAERPESKYRFFRPQGILLDCDTKYVHGGGETDSGSGTGKFVKDFKRDYIFGGYREKDRKYISDLIKTALNMDDEKYKEFVEKYKNVPLSEIEPEETRAKLIKAFSEINSNTRKGKREYNEMYISNPKPPMAVFAYEMDENDDTIDNPIEFLHRTEQTEYEKSKKAKPVEERTEFLRQYALERNIPFIVFGKSKD